MKHKRFEA